MRHGCPIPLLALLAALAAVAPPVAAAPQAVTRFVPSAGQSASHSAPVLVAGDTAWARSLPIGDWVVERGAPGLEPGRVALSRRPNTTVHELWPIGASSTRIAWVDHAWDLVGGRSATQVTRRRQIVTSASAAPVAGCGGTLPPCECPPTCATPQIASEDMSGDVLVYLEGPYTDTTIVIDDLRSGTEPIRLDRSRVVDYVQIAGDHVAWFEGRLGTSDESRTVVWNWREGREVFAIPRAVLRALQPDGKVAVDGPDGAGLSWHAPDDRTRHPIDAPPGRYYANARMAADRLLFTEGIVDGARAVRLLTSDLAGNVETVASGATLPYVELREPLDFDGRRAAWTTRACGLVAVLLDTDVTVPRGDPAPPPACSPPLIADLRYGRGGRVVVKLVCARGCEGRLALYDLSASPRRRVARRAIDLPSAKRARSVTLVPAPEFRQRLAGGAKLRVQALFSGRDGRAHRVGAADAGSIRRP